MSYYVKAFCKSETKPTIQQVLDHLLGLDLGLDITTNLKQEALKTTDWVDFEYSMRRADYPYLSNAISLRMTTVLQKKKLQSTMNDSKHLVHMTAVQKKSSTIYLKQNISLPISCRLQI